MLLFYVLFPAVNATTYVLGELFVNAGPSALVVAGSGIAMGRRGSWGATWGLDFGVPPVPVPAPVPNPIPYPLRPIPIPFLRPPDLPAFLFILLLPRVPGGVAESHFRPRRPSRKRDAFPRRCRNGSN